MLKIKSIINALQNGNVLYLDVSESEFIVKDAPNCYLVVSNYYEAGCQYCNLDELKSFINHNESVFVDMFSSDTKFINRNSKKDSIDKKSMNIMIILI